MTPEEAAWGPPSDGVSGEPAGVSHGSPDVPAWLERLARRAVRMPVPALLRPPPNGGRDSAVLVLFGDGPDLLLIQRSSGMRKHPGQPAFPGGGVDPQDAGPVGAALREAYEETGLDVTGVDVVATLPELYVWRSGNRVTPVLAWWREPCAVYAADPGEVEAVARVHITELADPANRVVMRHPSGHSGPAFRVQQMLVWGFTAGLIDRLLEMGGWEQPWDRSRMEDLPPDVLDLAARG